MNYIRKISVGADYKNAMHYVAGQSVLGGEYVIHEIAQEPEGYSVWIKKSDEVVKWKYFTGIPTVIEYNINLI
jgi:hypothetical protein